MPTQDFDAVIIGAGPNGLVVGNVLADAGLHVLVLEAQDRIGGAVVESLLSPFPPVRAGLRAALKLRKVAGLSFIRMLLEPSRTLTETRLRGSTAQLLIAGNAAHADIPPDAAGSGLFGWLLASHGG